MGPLRTRCLKDLTAWQAEGISLDREGSLSGAIRDREPTCDPYVELWSCNASYWIVMAAGQPIRVNTLLAGM